MTATTAAPDKDTLGLTSGQLRWPVLLGIAIGAVVLSIIIWTAAGNLAPVRTIVLAWVLFALGTVIASSVVEGKRKAKDRFATLLICSAFVLALVPLISLVVATITNGSHRFDATFFTNSMRNVVGAGGGAVHAIIGTLWVTGIATVISVPIGLLTAIYLVEYGRGKLARAITFFVDVMTGIPSIVAGLFAYSLFVIVFGPGTKTAIAGAVALSVLIDRKSVV